MKNSSNILDSISNEFNNVEKVRSQLFNVMDVNVPAPFSKEGSTQFEDPSTKIIYTDDGRYLGTTGKQYESIQPSAFLDSIVQSVDGCNVDLNLDELAYQEFKGGSIINFKIPCGIIGFKNTLKKSEDVELFINLSTGFGGYQRTEAGLYAHRFVCTNGQRIVSSAIELKVKHTANMNVKAMLFCDELLSTIAKVQETKKIWQQMDSTQVTVSTARAFAMAIAGAKKNEVLSTRKKGILDKVNQAISIEFQRTGTTAYGLMQGATYYTNHLASGHSEEYINTMQGKTTNELAQRLAMELVLN
jgi:hypothetical protein